MQGFSSAELVVKTADGHNFVLLDPFTYTRKDGAVITVPRGSTSDGASTPSVMWNLFPPFGDYWKAAFLHDYLYRYTKFTKDFADETFLEAMEWLGVDQVTAHTMYEGVHVFGWLAFREERENQRTP